MQALAIKSASASPLSILLAGNNLARLLGGLAVTVRISLIAVALSIPLGILFGLLMTRENRIIKLFSRIYLDFIRIMPQLVLLFLVFFGSAVLVFTLWGTAEMGDLVRGALNSIPKHQYESAAALGLTAGQCSRYVIIPQTLRRLLPLAINLVTRMVKTTSLVVLIGVVEVLKTGQQIIDANRFQYPTAALPIYGVIFLLYFLICWPVSMLARYLEQRWAV